MEEVLQLYLSQQHQPDVCVSMINCKMLAYSQAGSSRTLSLMDFEICQNRYNALSSIQKKPLITQILNLGQHDWCAYFDERYICSKFSWQVFSSWHFTKELPINARNERDVSFCLSRSSHDCHSDRLKIISIRKEKILRTLDRLENFELIFLCTELRWPSG